MRLMNLAAFGLVVALGVDARGDDGDWMEKGDQYEKGVLRLSREDEQSVKAVLRERGYGIVESYDKEGADDDAFEKALEKFQKDVAIEETGEVDIATLNALGFQALIAIDHSVAGAELVNARVPAATELPAGVPTEAKAIGGGKKMIGYILLGKEQIEAIEESLEEAGFLEEADDTISQETVRALEQYQTSKGVKQGQGLLNLSTLAWLPDSGVKVEMTDKPESELGEPMKTIPGAQRAREKAPPSGEAPEGTRKGDTPRD